MTLCWIELNMRRTNVPSRAQRFAQSLRTLFPRACWCTTLSFIAREPSLPIKFKVNSRRRHWITLVCFLPAALVLCMAQLHLAALGQHTYPRPYHHVRASEYPTAHVAHTPSTSNSGRRHLLSASSNTSNSKSTGTSNSKGSLRVSGANTSQRQSAGSSSLLASMLQASAVQAHTNAYRQKLRQAAATPINIAGMTSLFWEMPTDHTKNCKVDGIPLDCRIQMGGDEAFINKADALYYHVPSFDGKPRAKAFPNQLRIAMSLESAAYYPNLDNPSYMCEFDAEMTYRTCAQVTNWYSLEALDKLFEVQPVPFEEKLHAIAYINRNCDAQSGRSAIMHELIALGDKAKVPVHALGDCDRNRPWPAGTKSKIDVMRKYKFCVAMENSVRQDYMTEKIWDALAAGCIPVYLGSGNTPHIIPDPNSLLLYDPSGKSGHASTPAQLDAVMHEIGSTKSRYQAMLDWKLRKPEEQPSDVFRYLWSQRNTTGECFLCQFLARHRAAPQPRYTTCLFNTQWMASAGQALVAEDQICRKQTRPS